MRWIVFAAAACGAPPLPPPQPAPVPPPILPDAPPAPPDLALGHTPAGAPRVPDLPRPLGELPILQRAPAADPTALAFDPTGTLVASVAEGTLTIGDIATGELRARWSAVAGDAPGLAFSPDGTRLALANADATSIVELATGAIGAPIACPRRAAPAWTPDGNTLVLACAGALRVWDVASRSERYAIAHDGPSALSLDGSQLAVADRSTVEVRAVADGHRLATRALPLPPLDLAWRPDGGALAVGDRDTARVYDAAALGELASLTARASSLAFSPDGAALVLAGHSEPLAWRLADGRTTVLDRELAVRVRWPASGRILVDDVSLDGLAVAPDGTRRVDVRCRGGCGELAPAWSRDGTRAADREDGAVVVTDAIDGVTLARFDRMLAHEAPAISDDGAVVLLPDARRAIDLATGRIAMLPAGLERLSPDGAHVLARSRGGWLVADARTGRAIAQVANDKVRAWQARWSGDGAWLFVRGEVRGKVSLRVWAATGTRETRTIELPAGARDVIAIPHSSRVFVRGAHVVADLATGRTRAVPAGGSMFAASDDGKRIVVGRTLYDASTLAAVETLAADARALTPRGDAVIVRGDDDTDVLHVAGGEASGDAPFLAPLTSYRSEHAWSPDGARLLAAGMLWDGRGTAPIAATRATAFVGDGCVAELGSTVRLVRIATGDWLDIAAVAGGPVGLVAIGSDGTVEGGAEAIATVRGGTPVIATGVYASVARFVAACQK